jgi:dTDP-4-dehydrorhamnose reductase
MKKNLVVGYKGKLGSLLIQRSNFFPLECDVTHPADIEYQLGKHLIDLEDVDVVVNCAGMSSIDECEKNYQKAIDVNVHGLQNLHQVFGERVLNISSDHIFSGKGWYLPKETVKASPICAYGFTKMGAEAISEVNDGKTIRLSRCVSLSDPDMVEYLTNCTNGVDSHVPSFFRRNYIHPEFAVDGIEYMANHWDSISEDLVNYASMDNWSMYVFVHGLVDAVGLDSGLIVPRHQYTLDAPRPKHGGLNVGLADKLGFPIYSVADTISRLVDEYGK